MPGVIIRTATRSGPVNPDTPDSARYFVVGQFERGPSNKATLVRSLAELELKFGGRVAWSNAYDDLRTYFEEQGAEAYVTRVVGGAATLGTLTLSDATPAPTLRVDAIGAGAWSANVTVQVAAGTLAGTYKLVVTGPADVETFDNLTTSADAVYALAASKYVRGTDLGGAAPAILAATALSAGNDDHAAITAANMTAGLAAFGSELGAGAVAIPGYASSLTGADLRAHASANRRIALTATAAGATEADATNAADALIGNAGGEEHVGLFYPWVRIPMGGGATKLISPEGYVAAVRARAHRDVGPWAAPAGDSSVARFVLGLEVEVPRDMGDRLDEAHVSAIRTIAGTTRLYGWRSMSTDDANYALLTSRDLINVIAVDAEARLERFVFKSIDASGKLYASIAAELVGIVDPYRAAGGLYARVVDGEQQDPGYSVDVGPTVNTEALIAANKVAAVLALRPSPVGTLVDLTIVKAGLTANVS